MFATLLSKLAVVTYTTTTTTTSGINSAALAGVVIFTLAVAVFLIAAQWKVFAKAGKPGWASIIPIYNLWVLFEIAGKPGWWALLSLIPIVNIVVIVLEAMALIEIAKRFGKSGVWGFFLLFVLPIIGWPILGFGKAQYQGGDGAAPVTTNGSDATPPAPVVNPVPPTVVPEQASAQPAEAVAASPDVTPEAAPETPAPVQPVSEAPVSPEPPTQPTDQQQPPAVPPAQ